MGLLKHFRSKSKLKDASPPRPTSYEVNYPILSSPPRPRSDLISRLPEKVLARVFSFVCPHTSDTSFLPSEDSQIGDGCMLCDLRDLAHCAQVCRKWYSIAQGLLYRSVRIDAVHYCALEEELAEKRKKSSKFRSSKNVVEPLDVPHIRLQLLCRSVRENANLADQVQILKLPYMTRETAKGDLARTVSALPRLQYADLPDGFASGDASCITLRQELQARCPDIRKMTYRAGAEEALELLSQRHWQNIEILELDGVAVQPATLRLVLASLPVLREVSISGMHWLDDSIFQRSSQIPDFPPVQTLKMVNVPNVTARGFKEYLQDPQNRDVFFSLTLENTGVAVNELSTVLWAASNLQHLSITAVVSKSLGIGAGDLPPLTSISLKTLHYEILSSDEVHSLQKPAESYYAYLASSLHRNALPALETLFVRDQNFPDLLLMPPMPTSNARPSFSTSGSGTRPAPADTGSLKSKGSNLSAVTQNSTKPGLGPTLSSNGGNAVAFSQQLEVYSKGAGDVEWVFTSIAPPSGARKGSISGPPGARPLSAYSASKGLTPQWAHGGFGSEARKSVLVGNGYGGFLAVPQLDDAPKEPVPEEFLGATRWGSVGTQSSGHSSFLKPPPSMTSVSSSGEKRHSKHDLWR
ncbi:hypothetical protein BDY17DRAFT_297776 [Neohortaea acidophila]|uniref:F-box domain-containing protein n=1 Tax=Neohortaea acidophila TaxID=245834 RepID=A0A6A6PU65_9PEZI|nr:uncharacterized protein BDY17DRAFT_297776 [Neohortaea acidophila]KAF2483648.1 hypothetical protein BDY17DRAFT_297776 [Neohortaea acidophila]